MRLAMIRFSSKIAGPVFYSRESALVFLFFHEFAGPLFYSTRFLIWEERVPSFETQILGMLYI